MTRSRTVSDSVVVDASPTELYDLISDVVQIPRWSPENTGATLVGPGPLGVGTSFRGTNRRGNARWTTESVVTAADPGERFAFRVRKWGVGDRLLPVAVASWEYRFAPAAGGTLVTETWTDDRPWPDAVAAVVDRVLTRGSTFADFQGRNIRRTLDRLKADVEQR